MSPHVLVQAERHEEPSKLGTLTASLFFCFICFSLFTLGSLFVAYLERYKLQIVRTLLSPFGNSHEGGDAQLNQSFFPNQEFDEKHLRQADQQLNASSPSLLPADNHGHDCKHSFTMGDSEFRMDSNDKILFHVRVTIGCNGFRDLYNVGVVRQDTLEKRIDGAIDQLSILNIVSICAVWFRERICRSSASGVSLPDVEKLCVFLQRRGCSRDMCCQIFFAAFHRLHPHLANQISLRVSGETLTDSRSIVDYIYDHWKRWLEEAQAVADHDALLAAANDPNPPDYPAYNHNLHTMPIEKYQKHVQESFRKLHKHQNHHYYHDSRIVQEGPAALHEKHQPGDHAPYDLGQASTWGSGAGQTERCKTRSDDCVCKQCSITGWLPQVHTPLDGASVADTFLALSPTESDDLLGLFNEVAVVPQQEKNTVTSNRLIPGPEYICPYCGQQGDHYDQFCTVNRKAADFVSGPGNKNKAETIDTMLVDTKQVEADDKSSSDLIMLSSGSEADEAQPTCFKDDGGKAFGSVPNLRGLRLTDGRFDDDENVDVGVGDGACAAEADFFLTTVEEKAHGRGSLENYTDQQEARKKQKLDEAYEETSLLGNLLEMDEEECIEQGLSPCPQTLQPQLQPQQKSDIEFGVTDKPLGRDPSYDPAVHELFHNQDNTWIQKANRMTALEMWDCMYLDECYYYSSSESEYDPY
ncbi:hypothetical protein HDV64DRAFT_291390 [Trichoderma sp. TUCIM 5745]